MPTYDYHCRACDHAFEHFQSMTSKVLRKCPECGERRLRRLIGSGAGVIFKGSGFYETDYKKGRGKKTGKDAAGGASAGESKSDTTADGPQGDGAKSGSDAGPKPAKPSTDAGSAKPSKD